MKTFRPEKVPVPSFPGWSELSIPGAPPTDIEIGTGVGWHAIQYGQKHPDRRLVAIEHTTEKFEKFRRRLENHPALTNVHAVHANAVHWITHFVASESIEKIITLFPNPYPKASQSNKRWHRMPFLERLVDSLKIGGTWTLATNEDYYWREAVEVLRSHPRLQLIEMLAYSQNSPPPWSPRSHFEKKYLQRGETCTQLVFRRLR